MQMSENECQNSARVSVVAKAYFALHILFTIRLCFGVVPPKLRTLLRA